MELLVNYSEFESDILQFRKEFEDFSKSKIENEDQLKEAENIFKSIKKRCAHYVVSKTSDDVGKDFAQLIQNENLYHISGNIPLHQSIKRLLERGENRAGVLTSLFQIVKLSDPLFTGRSFEKERENLTVSGKMEFLLRKLYELRKDNRYWDAATLFRYNQVALDSDDEAREIGTTLKDNGYVDGTAIKMGIAVKITAAGKQFVEENLNKNETVDNQEQIGKNPSIDFINLNRIEELNKLDNVDFDIRRLVRFCEEINDNYARGNYLSVAMIGRSIINHIPPIFGFKIFNEVANNYGGKSFKGSMNHLNNVI